MKSFESDRHIPIYEWPIKSTRETFSTQADAKMLVEEEMEEDKEPKRQNKREKNTIIRD